MQKKVMLVDDSATIRRAAELLLRATEFDLSVVASAEEALLAIDRLRPELIFIDADMPGVDGFELCAKLRAIEAHKGLPIVLMVSCIDPDVARIDAAESDGHVIKPFGASDLLDPARMLIGGDVNTQDMPQSFAEFLEMRSRRDAEEFKESTESRGLASLLAEIAARDLLWLDSTPVLDQPAPLFDGVLEPSVIGKTVSDVVEPEMHVSPEEPSLVRAVPSEVVDRPPTSNEWSESERKFASEPTLAPALAAVIAAPTEPAMPLPSFVQPAPPQTTPLQARPLPIIPAQTTPVLAPPQRSMSQSGPPPERSPSQSSPPQRSSSQPALPRPPIVPPEAMHSALAAVHAALNASRDIAQPPDITAPPAGFVPPPLPPAQQLPRGTSTTPNRTRTLAIGIAVLLAVVALIALLRG